VPFSVSDWTHKQGRNSDASTKIARVMTYPLVLRCMKNPDLPFTLRASFTLLMQQLYVDVEPHKAILLVNHTRVRFFFFFFFFFFEA